MARQGRRLRRAGARRQLHRQDHRLLHQHRRAAVVRDCDAAVGRGFPDPFRLAQRGIKTRTIGGQMNLALWLEAAGKGEPSRPALGLGPRVLRNYGETASRVARLAASLKAMGLEPGERVAIAAKNSLEILEILYAIWHAGLAAVPA